MRTSTTRERQHGVQSVEIGLHVLKAMARFPRSIGLGELAKIADMPASKVHRYLVSLCRVGMVRQHPQSGRYSLSWATIQLGAGAQRRVPHLTKLAPLLQDLHRRSHLLVAAAIWTSRGPAIIRRAEGEYPQIIDTRVGSLLGLTSTSIGRLFAAFNPSALTNPVFDVEFADGRRPLVDGRKMDRAQWNEYVAQVRAEGVAYQQDDLIVGLQAIAVPVLDNDGRILLSISMLSLTRNISLAAGSEMASMLIKVVGDFSRDNAAA